MDLLFPSDVRSVVVCDQQFDADENGIVRGIEAHVAREMMAHDNRITAWTDPVGDDGDDTAAEVRAQIRTARIEMINGLSREAMFAEGRAHGIKFNGNFSNEKLRSLLISHLDSVPITDEQLQTEEQRAIAARAGSAEARANPGGLVSGADTAAAERERLGQQAPAEPQAPAPVMEPEGNPDAITAEVDDADPLAGLSDETEFDADEPEADKDEPAPGASDGKSDNEG